MGINTHYYTVYGVKIDNYDEALSEELYGDGDKYEVVKLLLTLMLSWMVWVATI